MIRVSPKGNTWRFILASEKATSRQIIRSSQKAIAGNKSPPRAMNLWQFVRMKGIEDRDLPQA
jgi:hypothetical protein